jgi:hypothetical protein
MLKPSQALHGSFGNVREGAQRAPEAMQVTNSSADVDLSQGVLQ